MFPHPSNTLGGDHPGGGLRRIAEYPGGDGRHGYGLRFGLGRDVQGRTHSLPQSGRIVLPLPVSGSDDMYDQDSRQAAAYCDRRFSPPDLPVLGDPVFTVRQELLAACRGQSGGNPTTVTEILVGGVDYHINACCC